MTNYTQHFNAKVTPQSEPIPGKAMVRNNAGGFTFEVTPWTRLDRFLILGSDGGTYYQTERALTRENAKSIESLIREDGVGVVRRVVEISDAGRAPRNDPAIFVLAMCLKLGDSATRAAARAAVSRVCRIGTHLFHLARDIEAFGGWGRGTRKAIANWYQSMPVSKLAMQAVKYQSRDGWSHRDLLRLSHPKTSDAVRDGLFHYIVKGVVKVDREQYGNPAWNDLRVLDGFEMAKEATSVAEIVRLIVDYKLPRECVPTQFLNAPEVWDALLPHMGLTAMMRNLGKMTSIGLIKPLSSASKMIVSRFSDADEIKAARLHPMNILLAYKTYSAGRGVKGSLSWSPDGNVVSVLDSAFYASFGNITPSGKRFFVGVDVSGSMSSPISGTHLNCDEAAAAMALVVARTEPWSYIVGFDRGIRELKLNSRSTLRDAINAMNPRNGGGTDCSLPMVEATRRKLDVDVFTVITDNETWAGAVHPVQALKTYRQSSGRPAKSAVFGMTASGFSIADPADAGMMDFVGFDSGAVQVFEDFCRDGRDGCSEASSEEGVSDE